MTISKTHEEVIQNLANSDFSKNVSDRNFLCYEAKRLGIDFDEDTKDEFNRINNNLE